MPTKREIGLMLLAALATVAVGMGFWPASEHGKRQWHLVAPIPMVERPEFIDDWSRETAIELTKQANDRHTRYVLVCSLFQQPRAD